MPFLNDTEIKQLNALQTYRNQILIADSQLTTGEMTAQEYDTLMEKIVAGVKKIEDYYGIKEYDAKKEMYRESFDAQMGNPMEALGEMFDEYDIQTDEH